MHGFLNSRIVFMPLALCITKLHCSNYNFNETSKILARHLEIFFNDKIIKTFRERRYWKN